MRLQRVRVKNYRSIFDEVDQEYAELDLAPEGNYIVGPNNTGKSNIIRAIQLALRPGGREDYDPDVDIPKQKLWARPTITLDFVMDRRKGPYETLLKYVKEYEESVIGEGEETFAEEGRVRFYVQYQKGANRQEFFQAKGAGARSKSNELLERALDKFRSVVRFVDIRSGEDLESLLQRGFNELFTTVLAERYKDDIENARAERMEYADVLTDDVFGPVKTYLEERLPKHIRDIKAIDVRPDLRSVDFALSNPTIELDDAARTPLELKGTGVRSAMILTFMSFIAQASRRAVVFAIEEPEAFLHPGRHADLAEEMESFTNQGDISLLVTTHSPFLLSRDSDTAVFTVSKTPSGQTLVEQDDEHHDAVRQARRLLTGSEAVPTTMDLIDSVSDRSQAIIVVEGGTDRAYLQLCAQSNGRQELLEKLHIVPGNGAKGAVKEAVVLREVFEGDRPVYVILDDDDHGKSAYETLTDRLRWQGRREVSKYSRWRPRKGHDVEAEDLFPTSLLEAFVDHHGEGVHDGYLQRRDGGKHFEIKHGAKEAFVEWIAEEASSSDFERWDNLLDDVANEVGLGDDG